MKTKIIAPILCMMMLATIPLAAGMTISSENTTETTDLLGWTIIRGLAFNLKKVGNDLIFKAVRIHYTQFTGSEMSMGVMRLQQIKVSDLGPDRQLTLGPLGSFTWIIAMCHGGITEI